MAPRLRTQETSDRTELIGRTRSKPLQFSSNTWPWQRPWSAMGTTQSLTPSNDLMDEPEHA
jgi:antirestriction protein ArdC